VQKPVALKVGGRKEDIVRTLKGGTVLVKEKGDKEGEKLGPEFREVSGQGRRDAVTRTCDQGLKYHGKRQRFK